MRRIETDEHVAEGLDALVQLDPRLASIRVVAGDIPLRRREPGFEGLARIIVSQQVSVAAATAIWDRFAQRVAPLEPEIFLTTRPEDLKLAGLSAPKIRTLTAISEAVVEGRIDLEAVADLEPDAAHQAMTLIKGIGPWTADIYLLFCAGHPDVWPGGDLALQAAVGEAFGLGERPAEKACRALAEVWHPWRSVAARLFWSYYKARREGREGVAL